MPKKIKKYKHGNKLEGMLRGPSHEEGGIKFEIGGELQEAEGGEFVISKKAVESLGEDNLEIANATGEWPEVDARNREEAIMSKDNEIPKYDAGARIKNIKGYGDGGEISSEKEEVRYYQDDKGKFSKEYPHVKSERKSQEDKIDKMAKKLLSGEKLGGEWTTPDVRHIVRMVESKEKRAKKLQKYIKSLEDEVKKEVKGKEKK
jgi:hypothetical protein